MSNVFLELGGDSKTYLFIYLLVYVCIYLFIHSSCIIFYCSLVCPLHYCSDFRPFFTIHDTEFKEYTTRTQAPWVICSISLNPSEANLTNKNISEPIIVRWNLEVWPLKWKLYMSTQCTVCVGIEAPPTHPKKLKVILSCAKLARGVSFSLLFVTCFLAAPTSSWE